MHPFLANQFDSEDPDALSKSEIIFPSDTENMHKSVDLGELEKQSKKKTFDDLQLHVKVSTKGRRRNSGELTKNIDH